jgi:hypothetical protein
MATRTPTPEQAGISTLGGNPRWILHFFISPGTSPNSRYDPTVPYKLNFIRSVFHYFANERHLATDPTIKRYEDWSILQHACEHSVS